MFSATLSSIIVILAPHISTKHLYLTPFSRHLTVYMGTQSHHIETSYLSFGYLESWYRAILAPSITLTCLYTRVFYLFLIHLAYLPISTHVYSTLPSSFWHHYGTPWSSKWYPIIQDGSVSSKVTPIMTILSSNWHIDVQQTGIFK